jgi:hypothetical protein
VERIDVLKESDLRGYILEEVLGRLLSRSGYRLLSEAHQDPDALRTGRHGLLARGRGADHQADALGDLIIPTPFSLPIRLFVEAKFKIEPVGIADIRNAQGVISDINEHFASDGVREFPLARYHYRYSLFSVSGFSGDAQKYALAHQISLIDLQGPAFADLRAITERTAQELLAIAQDAGLSRFPLGQMRQVLRSALNTGATEDETADIGFEAAYARGTRAAETDTPEAADNLPPQPLAQVAADLSEQLDESLILGFPQGPFVLVLQADAPDAFRRFLAGQPSGEISVDIRYAPAAKGPGEWAIVPHGRRDLIVRFGVPPLLESWLLAADADELERAELARRRLFPTIMIFGDDNRVIQLRYRKVGQRERPASDDLSDPVTALRSELAAPELSFRGRQERESPEFFPPDPPPGTDSGSVQGDAQQRVSELDELPIENASEWNAKGLAALLQRLDDKHPVQAMVIRVAGTRPNGQVPRALVYELGGYEEGRTLRGFTRPVNRITRQIQQQGLVPLGVTPALETVYEHGVQATYFAVPPDVQRILAKRTAQPKMQTIDSDRDALQRLDDFLGRIPNSLYRTALRHILSSAAVVEGLDLFWGKTGCSLRAALPRQGYLSIGWVYPPKAQREIGLADLTLGYGGGRNIMLSDAQQETLRDYLDTLSAFGGTARPDSTVIRGWTFQSEAVIAHAAELTDVIQTVVLRLRAG